MKRSTERILTTHTGSLPRPAGLLEMLQRREAGEPGDRTAFEAAVRAAVGAAVRSRSRQASTWSTTASRASPATPPTSRTG
jgi:5-methyltetrahydropteroyltriglutamate--homocysteine methyltransferase